MAYLGRHAGQVDGRRSVLSRPEARGENSHGEVNAVKVPALGDVGPELLVDGVGERHVLEHPLQLAGKLTPAL